MDRVTNLYSLSRLLDAFKQTNDEPSRLRMRQAIYIHSIIELVLRESVDRLPEVSLTCRSRKN